MKDPKEKAKQFVLKMQYSQRGFIIPFVVAKQCAIICVNEIDSLLVKCTPKEDPYCYLIELEYWQSVKAEIEKL